MKLQLERMVHEFQRFLFWSFLRPRQNAPLILSSCNTGWWLYEALSWEVSRCSVNITVLRFCLLFSMEYKDVLLLHRDFARGLNTDPVAVSEGKLLRTQSPVCSWVETPFSVPRFAKQNLLRNVYLC